ncbi:CocE/NonD family hydrolase [Streptomyces sp. NPDC007095]|uniref:alpha/beta hydrolase n=1 Tax=Streptomyces sp. NPDC007095 TaxID=3154482 RepID=UPI003410594C
MRTDVTVPSAGLKLAGHLYTPDDGAVGPRPAIVVSHPGSGVKEQAAGLYALRLAEQGFVALAFDAAYQGESEGEPRGLEDPAHRVEDIKAAVSFLTARDDVDADRIGALGICASAGYVLSATVSDHRIKVVGTVSAVDIARQFRDGADGAQDPAVFQGMLAAAEAAARESRPSRSSPTRLSRPARWGAGMPWRAASTTARTALSTHARRSPSPGPASTAWPSSTPSASST